MVTPGYLLLAIIAGVLLLAFILGMAIIPDDTLQFI
jgi:hypothetical protein